MLQKGKAYLRRAALSGDRSYLRKPLAIEYNNVGFHANFMCKDNAKLSDSEQLYLAYFCNYGKHAPYA